MIAASGWHSQLSGSESQKFESSLDFSKVLSLSGFIGPLWGLIYIVCNRRAFGGKIPSSLKII
jgi:hypothetical protein